MKKQKYKEIGRNKIYVDNKKSSFGLRQKMKVMTTKIVI